MRRVAAVVERDAAAPDVVGMVVVDTVGFVAFVDAAVVVGAAVAAVDTVAVYSVTAQLPIERLRMH